MQAQLWHAYIEQKCAQPAMDERTSFVDDLRLARRKYTNAMLVGVLGYRHGKSPLQLDRWEGQSANMTRGQVRPSTPRLNAVSAKMRQ